MDFNTIVKFVEGSLSAPERVKVLQYILKNDYMFDVLKGLNNLQRNKSEEQSITDLIKNSKTRVEEKIFSTRELKVKNSPKNS